MTSAIAAPNYIDKSLNRKLPDKEHAMRSIHYTSSHVRDPTLRLDYPCP